MRVALPATLIAQPQLRCDIHIEKNFSENIINTIVDVHEKTKDNVNSGIDVAYISDRKELHLQPSPSGKTVKPKAKFILAIDERRGLCKWVKGLKMPDGYCSNLRTIAHPIYAKFNNVKSCNYHVLMETLLPVAFSALANDVLKPLIEIG